MLEDLAELGFSLAIDDFGTGYSSLTYLKEFPFHVLKIDRSFVKDAPQSVQDKAIVTTIIHLAHSLGMMVVAEGVETMEQYKLLRGLGCNEIQGFLFAKPVATDALPSEYQKAVSKWSEIK
jgi:EAL domain-containing protein (putative c-di-GMP-specific phosphodiesterase class I)